MDNPKLKEGRWWIRKGRDVPLHHANWFQCPTQNLQNPSLVTSTVADLIDQNSNLWKFDLVRAIYTTPHCSEILSILIAKTDDVSNKLMWKHSLFGEYEVRNAYNILLVEAYFDKPSKRKSPITRADQSQQAKKAIEPKWQE